LHERLLWRSYPAEGAKHCPPSVDQLGQGFIGWVRLLVRLGISSAGLVDGVLGRAAIV
tara:strand:+ start:304 stop:477 length:174 start_codon:yes stop_codon:yes gene_type:complete